VVLPDLVLLSRLEWDGLCTPATAARPLAGSFGFGGYRGQSGVVVYVSLRVSGYIMASSDVMLVWAKSEDRWFFPRLSEVFRREGWRAVSVPFHLAIYLPEVNPMSAGDRELLVPNGAPPSASSVL